MKTKILCLLIVLILVSCESSKNKKNTKKIVQSELLYLADLLELKEYEYEDLIDSVNSLNKKTDLFYRKIHIQKKEIDRLRNENAIFIDEYNMITKKAKPVLTEQQKALQFMVLKMHDAWADLAKTKNTKPLLNFFNTQYIVSRVSVDTDDTASVLRFTNEDFDDYLKENIIEQEGLSIEFADVNFLDIEVKDNSYFNIVYKCTMGTYRNDRLQGINSILVTITGENIKDVWGISSYSWVNFKYGS